MAITVQECDVKSIEVPSDVKGFLKHILGMNALDLQIYYELCSLGCTTVEDLAELIGKDKSTIYKSLKNLVDKGFARREVRILRKGGYKYIFTPTPPKELRDIIIERMDSCFQQVMAFIELLSII
ncbi:hypothetical protein DRP07_04745 [Archaeoglobales archaeon]|nr:MAG: hypothetical protein DRP07_04745 [Archaeoglobales archaeon]